jgi:hypothetical protein
MTPYNLALFLHILGAIGVFVGVSTWLFVAVALRRAHQVAQVRILSGLIQPSGVLTIASLVLLGVAGFYMALTAWGEQATWIIVATISFLLLAPFGALLIDPRLRAVGKEAATASDGALPQALAARIRHPLVGVGLCVYVGVLLGIVFLMTNKPPLGTAIGVMVVATLLGLASGVLLWRVTSGGRRALP